MDEHTDTAAAPAQQDAAPLAVEETQPHTTPSTLAPVKGAPPATPEPSAPSAILQTLTDRALYFLSHASNETLGACLVGLGATTYLVLGRVGLVFIGVAGGVVLHATWEGIRTGAGTPESDEAAQARRRRDVGLDVAHRVLAWRMSQTASEEKPEQVTVLATQQKLDFSSFGPATAAALTAFTDSVLKDYVHYWYDATLPGEESFPTSCRLTLTAFLLSVSGHLARKRPADAFLDFVTNASSITIVFLSELASALNASSHHTAEEAIDFYLSMKPDSSLSYMIDEGSQESKLADAAEDILQAYLDPKVLRAEPVRVFLKGVLAKLILGYTVQYCAKPEFINDWIVYGLEESETTEKVMGIVDAGVTAGTGKVKGKAAENAVDVRTEQEVVTSIQSLGGERVYPQEQGARSKKTGVAEVNKPQRPKLDHRRLTSKAEEAMDEAMREARRLTQLMIEEDERRAREEERHAALSSSEDVSETNTQGVATPTSSQSDKDRERQEDEGESWIANMSTISESTANARPMTPTAASQSKQQFTSFDQILPASQPSALLSSPERSRGEPAQLTLHNATISIFDDSDPNDRSAIKTKPQADYMVQIEPQNSAFAGWMIARRYADFEMLHEVLRRISIITGVHGFAQSHAELPRWRTSTKASLRMELERYLTDAVRFQPLAESEGMKRFLEKDQGLAKSPGERNGKGFGWPTPDAFGKLGGDMINVLAKAPKQVAGGGKTIFGGVAGLVKRPGLAGTSRPATNSTVDGVQGHMSKPSTWQGLEGEDSIESMSVARQSQESLRSMPKPSFERHPSASTLASTEAKPRESVASSRMSGEWPRSADSSGEQSAVTSPAVTSPTTPWMPMPGGLELSLDLEMHLPPLPSKIKDDFGLPKHAAKKSLELSRPSLEKVVPPTPPKSTEPITPLRPAQKPQEPLTERETSVVIELLFAIITELYTLSSAWQIRRTLLLAAKNFLLRPGNPQLLSIRDLLQATLLDAHLSDDGIAALVQKLRENGLPTGEELEVWTRDYPERNEVQKEELRVKARALLVQKGMPQALASVMGAAASGEALGRVFDSLQVESVGRGLVFGLVLQAIRVVTH
ncbi:hypothetical protein LTR53_007246 [Teratosphaeriaceae sp. CCFEE 6253]|nr:hypothetical protein LTR53_007246 [Teratosphaeriaceae sp. CCFEE 6253]